MGNTFEQNNITIEISRSFRRLDDIYDNLMAIKVMHVQSVCLSVCLLVCLAVCLSITYLPVCLFVSICLSVRPSVSMCLCVCVSLCLSSVCLCLCLSLSVSLSLSLSLSVSVSQYLVTFGAGAFFLQQCCPFPLCFLKSPFFSVLGSMIPRFVR